MTDISDRAKFSNIQPDHFCASCLKLQQIELTRFQLQFAEEL